MKKKEGLGFFDTSPSYNDWTLLGSFRKLQVWIDDSLLIEGHIDIEVIDPTISHGRSPQRKKRVLEVQLSKSENFTNSWHVNMTRLDHKYAGRGIAAQAYRYIIKKMDLLLEAGNSQSKGGRKVWYDLAQIKDLVVYGQTRFGQQNLIELDHENREVKLQNKQIYDGPKEMFVFACAV